MQRGDNGKYCGKDSLEQMDLVEHISGGLRDHSVRIIEPGDRVHSAVAIILRKTQTGLNILFIERSANENDPWSGQIAFPGGKCEVGDGSPRKTAERETMEELGLDLSNARYLGRVRDISPVGLPVVVSGFVYAVGQLPELHLNHNEVADAFWFPFSEISNPARYTQVKVSMRKKLKTFPAVWLFYGKKPPLWGITYHLLRNIQNKENRKFNPSNDVLSYRRSRINAICGKTAGDFPGKFCQQNTEKK